MRIISTPLPGVLLLEPTVFEDKRGYFFESYNLQRFKALGIDANFIQDNESRSHRHVLRGLHFQVPPHAQGKLVRVIRGSVQDVVVDLRKTSPTYGKWISEILSESNKRLMWIPEGFAHGFLALENDTVFVYKCTSLYHRESEASLRWDDPDLQIRWETQTPLLSAKDAQAMLWKDFVTPF